jgi:DNA invertase Pin-like site-specific DNA recombinase
MRAIGYLTEYGPPGEAATLAAQNDAFLRFCDANGYQPAAAFLDPLDGADASDRPGLRQLLHYLDAPEKGFIAVVVAAFARLGPERAAAARTYFQIVASGAQVISIAEGPVDDACLLRMWGDPGKAANGRRVRDAMRRRAIQGQVLGRPPYGYRVGEDRRLQIVEDEAALVRLIFDLYLSEGRGIRLIAKHLNEQGYRTRRGGAWSMVTIRDLLRNRVYVGTYTRFGVRVPGNHAAIISEADFAAVQARMAQRRRPAAKAQPGRFLLSGLVYCGEGGSRMIGVTRRQRWTRRDGRVVGNTYRYYQNEARTNQSIGEYHTRRADELEEEVLAHLTGAANGSGGGDESGVVRTALLHAGDANAVAAETALAESRLRSRLRSLDRRLADTLTAAADGQETPERMREVAAEITADYQHSVGELTALDRRAAAQASESERRRHRARQLARIRDDWGALSFDDRQALLRDVVERVIVEQDGVRTVLRV